MAKEYRSPVIMEGLRSMKQKIRWIYFDVMRVVWSYYHKFILHKGRFGMSEWLVCHHHNPFYRLTPRLWDSQTKAILKNFDAEV